MKKGLLMTLGGLSGIALVLEFMERHHAHGRESHHFLGFFFVFGLIAALLLAVFAKLILFKFIGRPQDYYDGPGRGVVPRVIGKGVDARRDGPGEEER